MKWRVVMGADELPWTEARDGTNVGTHSVVQTDPVSGWIEVPDNAVAGYRKTRFETEDEARRVALRLRAFGFSAATEACEA